MIKIYQSYFEPEQYAMLDPAFIPYDNIKNVNPLLREYPLLLDLYERNRQYDGYWGMVSRLFYQKTAMTGADFIERINAAPGYDVYHVNAFPHIINSYPNPFVQGEVEAHPGMLQYTNRLMRKLGYEGFSINTERFKPQNFVHCSYYVGNQHFWERWITFAKTCVYVSENDEELSNYLYGATSSHEDKVMFANFSFVMERLVTLFLHITPQIKANGFMRN
jgi:hypothetical protein